MARSQRLKLEETVSILMLPGLFITVVAWTKWGPVVGIIAGFLFMGGIGWKVLGLVRIGIVYLLHPEYRSLSRPFIEAWEEQVGEMRLGIESTQPPPGMFQAYIRDWKQTGVGPDDWLDAKFGRSSPE